MLKLPRWQDKFGAGAFLTKLSLLAFSLLLLSKVNFADVSPDKGKTLFQNKCSSCHRIDTKLVGPALKGIDEKQTEDWIIHWVHNNAEFRSTGDKDAIAIYEEFGKNPMPSFADLSDDDIRSILAFIKVGTPPPPPPPPPGTNPTSPTNYWAVILVGILIIIALLLVRSNRTLKHMALEREGHHVEPQSPLLQKLKSRRFIAFYIIIIVFALGYMITDSTTRLSHSKNYQPVQPIAFSHQLHAGINQINCLYCHASAEKGKVSGIPPLSTCMNCHSGVQEGQSDAGTAEIKKIYAYYDNNKPIPWIKIHNLPDHVYFNHSQHVVVGKVACQTCHGPIETMDQVYQFASLSMGWCVNCHRETGVQFKDNGYYTSMYDSLHHQLDNHEIGKVTEAMVGGTECQKCHY